ncbi:MAG: MBOAT family protein [Chloroflexi bacterium]|nr:MBOAT family protein [Chloroflexota bacterium]
MSIIQIATLATVALILGRLPKGRELALLAVSAFVVFWLQPNEPFVTLRFWLPVATLAIAVLAWALTSAPEARNWKQNWPAAVVLIGVILLMDLNRYFKLEQIYITGTPLLPLTLGGLAGIVAFALLLLRWQKANRFWMIVTFVGIIAVFIFLKTPSLTKIVSDLAASRRGQTAGKVIAPLSWLGFSYIAFRLMHTIFDRRSGRLPALTLGEYVNYVIFFPSFIAGPIDRADRFVRELRAPLSLQNEDWIDAGTRFFGGLFKKFVLADMLAVVSLNDLLVSQVKTAGWMWVFLYAYTLRIYFDFSGYTDMAIGVGRLMGIRLPENFAAPYLKPNLTQFWNSWHMTLTQWFRSYFFNPLTRVLRSGKRPWPIWLVILVTQTSAMVLIGLWHGVTAGFVTWGLWHGLGLFLQNRWSELVRTRLPAWSQSRGGQIALNIANVFLTFNFIALGWLFFTLSSPAVAWQAMLKLFGLS